MFSTASICLETSPSRIGKFLKFSTWMRYFIVHLLSKKKTLDEWDASDVGNMKEMSIKASAKLLKCITVIVQPPSTSPSLNETFLNQVTEISGTLLWEDAFHQLPKHHVWDGSRDVV